LTFALQIAGSGNFEVDFGARCLPGSISWEWMKDRSSSKDGAVLRLVAQSSNSPHARMALRQSMVEM
jgi:hypothetical protein